MSSIAAFPPGLDRREDEPLAPDDFPNPYVQHKAGAERLLFRMHAASGFPAVTFRRPYVHGPRQPFYREQFFWDRLLSGRPIILPDGGDRPMPWAFVDPTFGCARRPERISDFYSVLRRARGAIPAVPTERPLWKSTYIPLKCRL